MTDSNITFPEKKNKRPAWTRVLDIILRTAHVAITSILFGAAVFDVPFSRILILLYFAIGTGCALIASEFYHSRHWPYQGRGIMVLIHATLFGLIHLLPDFIVPLMTTVIVFGMIGSHMTKKLRYWSFIHRRVVE